MANPLPTTRGVTVKSAGDTDDHDTDTYWLGQGYATVVPCQVDQTAVQAIPLLDELSEFNHHD